VIVTIGSHVGKAPLLHEKILDCKARNFPPKIRFVSEQLGRYRIQKYIKEFQKSPIDDDDKDPIFSTISHKVNPILC
jgi:hypothetical protein